MSGLNATIDALYQRHLELTRHRDWSYHRLLPWERGKNFIEHPWQASEGSLSSELTLAVETALFTEINLPWFTAGLMGIFEGAPPSLHRFVHTWTREEDQHSRILDVYLALSRNGDPDARDITRKAVLEVGWLNTFEDPLALMVYTTLQELATRVFYINLAQSVASRDPALATILRTLAKDETLHYTFYRDAVKAYLDDDAGRMAVVCQVVPTFVMPGHGMPDFSHRLKVVAEYGGYGVPEYYDQVLRVVLTAWGVLQHDASSQTREPLEALHRYVAKVDRVASRLRPLRLSR